jgi:ribose transport system permease protein
MAISRRAFSIGALVVKQAIKSAKLDVIGSQASRCRSTTCFALAIRNQIAHTAGRAKQSGRSGAVKPALATGNVLNVPAPFIIFIVVCIVVGIVLHISIYGRYLYAIGRDEEAAVYSGINTKLMVASAYVLCGFLSGISAILIGFYTNSISPASHGSFFELYAVAACVLGGLSLRGGEGSILGIFIGTAMIQLLRNIVNLQGIESSLEFVVMGGVILVAVSLDQVLAARRRAREARIDVKAPQTEPARAKSSPDRRLEIGNQ